MTKCPACGARFGGITAFDLHRVGGFATKTAPSTRRCMSEDEMAAAGLVFTNGKWSQASPAKRMLPGLYGVREKLPWELEAVS